MPKTKRNSHASLAVRDLMSKAAKSSDGTATKLQKLIPVCPVCDRKIDTHQFALVAQTIIGMEEKSRVTELIGRVRKHDWDSLRLFKQWKADCDNAVVYAIRGPHDAGFVILIRSPFELYEPDEVFVREMVSADELATLSGLVAPDDWRVVRP